jgi:hypothetical protein
MDGTDRYPVARRVAAGGVILAGLAMLVLPGPGVVTLLGGFAMLERDLPAVRRGMSWVRKTWARLSPTG